MKGQHVRTEGEIKSDIRSARQINDANALRQLADEMAAIGTRSAEAASAGALGSALRIEGAYEQALEHYGLALTLHEALGDRPCFADVTSNVGIIYAAKGDYPKALEYFRRACTVYEELGDRAGSARVIGNMGLVYAYTGDYPQALDLYRRALAVHEEIGDRNRVALITGSIGGVYRVTEDYPRALEHYHRALTLHQELGNQAGVARVTGNIGNVHFNNEDYQQALEYYRRATSMHEELGDRLGVVIGYGNMVAALLKLQRDEEASVLLDQQEQMSVNEPGVRANYHANRATLAERQGDLISANEHLKQALSIADAASRRAETAEFHERLRDLAKKCNDFAGYIEHNNEYQRISEEIRGKETTQRMAMMEAERKMESERREREKERAVLYSTLPKHVADRVVRGEKISGDHYGSAAVIFLDIADFTRISDQVPPGHVVHLLEQIFSSLDVVVERYGVTKIKTIGDSYMAVAFPRLTQHEDRSANEMTDVVQRAGQCALDMLTTLDQLEVRMPPELGDTSWTKNIGEINVRIGIHCGPVTAGVIGTQRLQYDVWGDTVNLASRMESTGEPRRIQVSEAFALALGQGQQSQGQQGQGRPSLGHDDVAPGTWHVIPGTWHLAPRGDIDIKGKGQMSTYWLEKD